jgi:hypothetical protein
MSPQEHKVERRLAAIFAALALSGRAHELDVVFGIDRRDGMLEDDL